MTLTGEGILSADDLPVQKIATPEWPGGHAWIRILTGDQRDMLEMLFDKDSPTSRKERWKHLRARLAAMSLCDEKGTLLFTDDDIPRLAKKNGLILDRILVAVQEFNALGRDAIERLAKNSDAASSGDSGSSLRELGTAPSEKPS